MISDLAVIIVAGGSATRFGGNKLLMDFDGRPLFLHSVITFLPLAKHLVLVTPRDARGEFRRAAGELPILWADGGAFRCKSVQSGLAAIPMKEGFVAIHDAARPLASQELLLALLEEARRHGGAIPGKPVTDTLKRTDAAGLITETVPRAGLWRVETPQVFDLAKLRAAYAKHPDIDFTDDACVMEAAGHRCKVLHNPADNTKVTYPGDLGLGK